MYDDSAIQVDTGSWFQDIYDAVLAARAIDALTGETVWVSSYGSGSESTPAYHGGRLYYGREEYFCLDASTGGGIWSVPCFQHGSSAIADGMVFYGQINYPDNGGLRVLDCETGEEVWSYYPPNTVWIAGSPSVVDGIVYMPMHDWNLYAFGTGLKYTYTGEQLNSVTGWNDLVVTSFDGGTAAASDTISYYVNQTGIGFGATALFALACSPNPFLSSASLSFTLTESGFTSVKIYDLAGREVAVLVEAELPEGVHSLSWGCSDNDNGAVPPGLYLCRIENDGSVETTGMCVLR